jgi:signal transduction histidine kinase
LSAWAIVAYVLGGALLLAWGVLAYRERLRRRSAWQLAEHKRELAEQASQAKTRFLATLGHEVRTPMTGVLGMSELLLGTELDAPARLCAVHPPCRPAPAAAGQRCADLARIEAGKLELDPQDFDVPRAGRRRRRAGVAGGASAASRSAWTSPRTYRRPCAAMRCGCARSC